MSSEHRRKAIEDAKHLIAVAAARNTRKKSSEQRAMEFNFVTDNNNKLRWFFFRKSFVLIFKYLLLSSDSWKIDYLKWRRLEAEQLLCSSDDFSSNIVSRCPRAYSQPDHHHYSSIKYNAINWVKRKSKGISQRHKNPVRFWGINLDQRTKKQTPKRPREMSTTKQEEQNAIETLHNLCTSRMLSRVEGKGSKVEWRKFT